MICMPALRLTLGLDKDYGSDGTMPAPTGRTAMATKDTIAARLAEGGLSLNDRELDELVPAYNNLLR